MSMGDINGNGLSDIIIGAPSVNSNTGAIDVFYGLINSPDATLAASGDNTLTATANDQDLIANSAGDVLSNANYTGTVMYGGAGDDTITLNYVSNGVIAAGNITSSDFLSVDGEGGDNTLILGPNDNLDLTDYTLKITNFDVFELQGGTLTLDELAVVNQSQSSNTVRVDGSSGSVVLTDASSWNFEGNVNITVNGISQPALFPIPRR